jgi:hypothetical protein
MKRLCLAAAIATWIWWSFGANAQMNNDQLQHSGVLVTSLSSNPTSLNGAGLSSIAGRIPKGALLISNQSSKPIMVMVVKWTSILKDGSTKTKWLYLDGYYFSPSQAVLAPGKQGLVTRYGMLPGEQFQQLALYPDMHGSPLQSQYGEVPLNEVDTTGIIDSVIFSDGEIVGDDVSRYEQTVELRHRTLLAMEAELRYAGNASTARTAAEQIMLKTQNSSDRTDRVRHQIARAIASSGDPIAFVAEFKNHSIPKFYFSQSAR